MALTSLLPEPTERSADPPSFSDRNVLFETRTSLLELESKEKTVNKKRTSHYNELVLFYDLR